MLLERLEDTRYASTMSATLLVLAVALYFH
jgi:hypothetical protein